MVDLDDFPQYDYTVQTREDFLEEVLQTVIFSEFHSLDVYEEGDGWNEPRYEEFSCGCDGWEGPSWVQVDPECTGRPSMLEVVSEWLQHVNESELC